MVYVIVGLILAVLFALWLFLIAPQKVSPEAKAPFEKRAYAHRGLYEEDQSVPENSLTAFRRAAEAGYGAELDVQMTKDGVVMVMHDNDLKRACGREEGICDLTLEEVQKLRLFGTDEPVPQFSEVLEIFAGKQPLVVELKSVPNKKELSAAVVKMLAEYDGPACVESFDPVIVQYFRKHDPDRVRGQLSAQKKFFKGALPWYSAFALSRLLSNFLARPNFIAYCVGKKPLSVRVCERMGAMKAVWTAHGAENHARRMAENDVVIFEWYRPEA